MRPTLIVFVKEPLAGRVKTRLGREIGMAAAAQWFRNQSSGLIRRLSRDPRWETVLAVAPDTALASPAWPAGAALWPQGRGDLGARMQRALRRFGSGPRIIVGADIPGIGRREIADAFRALRGRDAVFGPAPDGGYWLVGMRGTVPGGFMEDVRWSSPHTLADTEASLPRKARIAHVAMLRDVDTLADLHALQR